MPDALPHVVILGGGFAGLCATRALARAPARITLVDRHNHHLFQPLLYQVATAGLSAPSIAAPLRQILRRQRNVTVLMDEVVGIDLAQRRVRLTRERLAYDWLLVATGATHAYFGHDDWAADAPGLKSLDDALAIRRRVLTAFERAEQEDDAARRQAWLDFVVVGGGATGVELAGTLAEIARHTLTGEFRRAQPRAANILLVEAGPRVLAAFDPALSTKAQRQLEHLGVQVRLGQAVTAVDCEGVTLGGERIAARTVLWAAGGAASPLGRRLGTPLDRAGRVLVQPDLSLPGYPEVFVLGDLASVQQDGRPVAGLQTTLLYGDENGTVTAPDGSEESLPTGAGTLTVNDETAKGEADGFGSFSEGAIAIRNYGDGTGSYSDDDVSIQLYGNGSGTYVSDGATHATIPKGTDPKAVTLDEAIRLIDERAAKGPPAKKGRKPARKKK